MCPAPSTGSVTTCSTEQHSPEAPQTQVCDMFGINSIAFGETRRERGVKKGTPKVKTTKKNNNNRIKRDVGNVKDTGK